MKYNFDVIVIGSGPGGYVAAIKSAQLGLNVAIIEKEEIGGVCLNWGCIPTKTLLRSAEIADLIRNSKDFGINISDYKFDLPKMVERSKNVALRLSNGVKYLLAKNKISLIKGIAKFVDSKTLSIYQEDQNKSDIVTADNIIIATGAKPKELSTLPVDGNVIWNYRNALRPKKIPKKLIIIGSGAIGIEFASFYNSLGTNVFVLEMQDRILPVEDLEISKFAMKQFEQKGINFYINSNFDVNKLTKDEIQLNITSRNKQIKIDADHLLVAIGVKGCIESLGLNNIGLKTMNHSILTNQYGETSVKGIYAIGDVTKAPCLAHKASHQGIMVAELISGNKINKILKEEDIPGCTYSNPQIASIGLTEEQAKKQGYNLKIGNFPFTANGKALALGEENGFIKTIFDKKTGELLGAHMVGAEVTELISTYIVGKGLEITPEEFVSNIFPHPTMSEMLYESVLSSEGKAIHF